LQDAKKHNTVSFRLISFGSRRAGLLLKEGKTLVLASHYVHYRENNVIL